MRVAYSIGFALALLLGVETCAVAAPSSAAGASTSPANAAAANAAPANAAPALTALPKTSAAMTVLARTYVGDAQLLVDNQEIVAQIRQMVKGARRSIALDYYVLGGPQALELADLLVAKQASGVSVRVLLDPDMGSLPALMGMTQPVLKRLRAADVPVRFYPRDVLAKLHGYRYVEDHNKSVVVDGAEAVCTSMNFGSDLLLNHDVGVHITGNAAHAMDSGILSAFALGAKLGPEHRDSWPSAAVVSGQGVSEIAYVPSGLSSNGARKAVLSALAGAHSSVEVMMSQLEDAAAVSGLIGACHRGVKVRVLVDPNEINHLSPLGWAPEGVFNLQSVVRLAAAGVDVRWFQISKGQHALHAKCALVDGKQLLVGSTNWNSMSFDMNAETMLAVDGGAAPRRFASTFNHDWQMRSAPFKKDVWSLLGPRLWAYGGLAWLLN